MHEELRNPKPLGQVGEAGSQKKRVVRREVVAMSVVGLLLVASALAFFAVDAGTDTAPVQRTEQQNSGGNAPMDQALSPGTVKDESGDAELPEQQ